MTLAVTKGTYITHSDGNGYAIQSTVEELVGKTVFAFDWEGWQHRVHISEPVEESIYATQCGTGEMTYFGESTTILSRVPDQPRWARRPIADIADVVMVALPQRKIKAADGLFDLYDLDDKGAFLEPRAASDMFNLMRKASFCGVTALRRKTELRIDLDRSRPVCFVNKLINGSFQQDLDKSLGSLVASGIIRPWGASYDEWLGSVEESGILSEGANVFNNVPLLPARKMERKLPVYHVVAENPRLPVEITWMCA